MIEAEALPTGKLRNRLPRIGITTLLIVLAVGFYRERASHSQYLPTAARDVREAAGTLVEPRGRVKNWPILIRLSGSGPLQVGCHPNGNWSLVSCIPLETYRRLIGQTVTIRYFQYDDAMSWSNVAPSMRTAKGQVVIDPDKQLRRLESSQRRDSRHTFASTIPLSLVVAFFACISLERWIKREAGLQRRIREEAQARTAGGA